MNYKMYSILFISALLSIVGVCESSAPISSHDHMIDNPSNLADSTVSFETSHKVATYRNEDDFKTSHSIMTNLLSDLPASRSFSQTNDVQNSMNLLPTKERPELNPILSALINEDVMKSIEAKRAIEQKELDAIHLVKNQIIDSVTEAPNSILTTTEFSTARYENINEDFVDQIINLESAGSENNKKSRIQIKKGPNGQDYEYEYIYYYDDEDIAEGSKETDTEKQPLSGQTKFQPNTASTNALIDNSIKSEKDQEERLPVNARFPSRGKNASPPQSTSPLTDGLESMSEKKKITVKRPSLELVDSDSFNTDEKQLKGSRNAEIDAKSVIGVSAKDKSDQKDDKAEEKTANGNVSAKETNDDMDVLDTTEDSSATQSPTTPLMEKAALDLYAILTNENFNIESTTNVNDDADASDTTTTPTIADDENTTNLMVDMTPSAAPSTAAPETTTPEAITTSTTTTTQKPSTAGGFNRNLPTSRNRYRSKQITSTQATSTTTETNTASNNSKQSKGRFNRPNYTRNRAAIKTTTTATQNIDEDEVVAKEVKPVSSGFAKNRPRNRFNLRATSTTERTVVESDDAAVADDEANITSSTTTTRRSRPAINLRGRSRVSTTTSSPAPTNNDEENVESKPDENNAPKETIKTKPLRPSRFNINRTIGNRRLPQPKETPIAEAAPNPEKDSTDDKDAANEKHETDVAPADHARAPGRGGATGQRIASPNSRRVNPLLSKRRLNLGPSTSEASTVETSSSAPNESAELEQNEDTTVIAEITTKQPKGLGLLGKRRRLPLRKPGTLL